MRTGADTQIHIGRRYLQSFEEDVGHLVVIMLACMHQEFVVPRSQFPTYRSRLDELRPGSHDGDNFHFAGSPRL